MPLITQGTTELWENADTSIGICDLDNHANNNFSIEFIIC